MNYFSINPAENDDKRAIDNPGLNQDLGYDKKDVEDFDDSDDFHKYDATDESADTDNQSDQQQETPESEGPDIEDIKKQSDVDHIGRYDGTIGI